MRRSATLRGLSAKEREAVDECAGYLLNYKDMLKYDAYWEFYKDQTLKRNHASQYQSFPLQEAA